MVLRMSSMSTTPCSIDQELCHDAIYDFFVMSIVRIGFLCMLLKATAHIHIHCLMGMSHDDGESWLTSYMLAVSFPSLLPHLFHCTSGMNNSMWKKFVTSSVKPTNRIKSCIACDCTMYPSSVVLSTTSVCNLGRPI